MRKKIRGRVSNERPPDLKRPEGISKEEISKWLAWKKKIEEEWEEEMDEESRQKLKHRRGY